MPPRAGTNTTMLLCDVLMLKSGKEDCCWPRINIACISPDICALCHGDWV